MYNSILVHIIIFNNLVDFIYLENVGIILRYNINW